MAVTMLHEHRGLLAIDRCDRCGVQAHLKVTLFNGGILLFCSHHGNVHLGKLLTVALQIDDYRPFLVAEERRSKATAVS